MSKQYRTKAGRILVLSLLLLVITGTLAAEPIGLVRVESSADAAAAGAILGRAYARTGNRFLVSATPEQQYRLRMAGLTFEAVLADADPQRVYQVYNLDHPQAPDRVDLRRLGEPLDLGQGLRVMEMSRAAAASLTDAGQMVAISLSDLDVRFFYRPPVVASAIADDHPADTLAVLVNQDSLFAYDQRLQDFQTRFTFTDSVLRARDWMAQKFRDWGYTDVTTPQFYCQSSRGSGWCYNVVAVKPGYAEPDKIIVIGGHYDSINLEGDTWVFAPGADDDASGVALTMEVARILADIPLRKTVVFIPFAAEEVGLVGSAYAASQYAANGAKLEVMFNYDMVGYATTPNWSLNMSSGDVWVYRNLSAAVLNRVSGISPNITYMGSSSDHYSFDQEGFNIVDNIETEFNYQGWHTNTDLTSMMNFPYLADVTRVALVSVAIVADAPYPTGIENVIDPGDGQSLEVAWDECSTDCSYLVSWGTEPGVYTDSIMVPAGECSYTINGLQDGLTYYVVAIGETTDGVRAFYGVEGSGVPYMYPRMPQNLQGTVAPDQLQLSISWNANAELDFSHYRVYRQLGEFGVTELYADHVTTTSFADDNVRAHVGYRYTVSAVDIDGYESARTAGVLLYPASYDGGPVVVDAFVQDHSYDPDQAGQEAWLDSVTGGIGYGLASADEFGGPVTLSELGQYSTLLWFDDDVIVKNIEESQAALNEFAQHNTNIVISGYRTFMSWSPKSVPTSHLLYREFGLSYYDYTAYFDFVGVHGQNGWPSVEIDPTRGMNEWRDIPKLTPRAGATVIGTFDSFMDLPGWEGEPVGLAYETANGKRVLISFPLYYLTPVSAQALLAKIFEYFGTSGFHDKGDLDHSGTIDMGDLALLLDHLFISLQPLPDPDAADMDGRPGVSLGDVFHLINYLFLGGPPPVPADPGQ